jgi:hypothetical protein
VVVLLRREASSVALTGVLSRTDETGEYLRFRYSVVKVWELPCEPFMTGPLGTLALALLTDEAQPHLPNLIQRIDSRAQQETQSSQEASEIITACSLLLGLRYDKDDISRLFRGVRGMRESSTYQAILEEGQEQGVRNGIRRVIRVDAIERFGEPSSDQDTLLKSFTDLDHLERIRKRIFQATGWDDLLQTK